MKTKTWIRRFAVLGMVICLGAAALSGCGSQSSSASQESGSEASEALTEYKVEGLGTFYLPEGFLLESGRDEEPLPRNWAQLTSGSVTVVAARFGKDAYEASGVGLPADLEEYSQRAGVRQGIPEDAEFAEDSYGNLYVQFTRDGQTVYQVLKKGTESYGAISIYCPEGEESEEFALWASRFVLE